MIGRVLVRLNKSDIRIITWISDSQSSCKNSPQWSISDPRHYRKFMQDPDLPYKPPPPSNLIGCQQLFSTLESLILLKSSSMSSTYLVLAIPLSLLSSDFPWNTFFINYCFIHSLQVTCLCNSRPFNFYKYSKVPTS